MTAPAEFTGSHREGDHVTKRLDVHRAASPRVATAAQAAGVAGMRGYLETLRSVGVVLPPELTVLPDAALAVRHRWVAGLTLLDAVDAQPWRMVDAVGRIAAWVRALDTTDARVDTNLANFIVAGDRLVLVDVLPPLIPSTRPEPADLFDVLFTALCFDTAVILDALIGYAARALLRSTTRLPSRLRRDLEHQMPPEADRPGAGGFPEGWFLAKAVLALRALSGNTAADNVHAFFDLTSVRVFRSLSEPERERRIGQATRTARELGLT